MQQKKKNTSAEIWGKTSALLTLECGWGQGAAANDGWACRKLSCWGNSDRRCWRQRDWERETERMRVSAAAWEGEARERERESWVVRFRNKEVGYILSFSDFSFLFLFFLIFKIKFYEPIGLCIRFIKI